MASAAAPEPLNGFPVNVKRPLSPRLIHTGGEPAIAAASGTELTPATTVVYLAELHLPFRTTVNGVAVHNGGVAAGNLKVALFDEEGNILTDSAGNKAASASTAMSGTDAYQRIPLATPIAVEGPRTLFLGLMANNTSARINCHVVGNFGAGSLTSHVYTTGFDTTAIAGLVMPTDFTTALGPIASLY